VLLIVPVVVIIVVGVFFLTKVPAIIVVIIAVLIVIPVVIVFDAPVRSIPVASVVPSALVPRRHPVGPNVGRFSPIARVPRVTPGNGIPVAIHPHVGSRWPRRSNDHNTRRRWRPNRDSNGNLRANA